MVRHTSLGMNCLCPYDRDRDKGIRQTFPTLRDQRMYSSCHIPSNTFNIYYTLWLNDLFLFFFVIYSPS